MDIRLDDVSGPEIAALLQEHLRDMHRVSPPESVHALDLEGLRTPDITVWTMWDAGVLAGCGALKELDPQHAEIKSMRTASSHRRQGVAKRLLQHLLEEAKQRGYTRVSLETGSMDFFLPARTLYASFGFAPCPPFADYREDPNSVFMTTLLLDSRGVDEPRAYTPTFVIFSSLKPLFFHSLKMSDDSRPTREHKTPESKKSV